MGLMSFEMVLGRMEQWNIPVTVSVADGSIWVYDWREESYLYMDHHVYESDKFVGGSVIVWGEICGNCKPL